jgi:uncharacterized RDD family membrane protein YckC
MAGVGKAIDLTGEAVPQGPVKANVDPKELARRTIAFILLAMLGAIIGVTLAILFLPDTVHLRRAKDLVGLILTPIIGLVGSVVGFYFGAQTVQQAQQAGPDGGG